MKIEFFQTEYGLDQEAVNGGVYKVELINSHKNKCACLYVGESVFIIKRCGEHLYELFKNPTYFGLNEYDLINSDFVLRFSVAESISEEKDKAMYKGLENKYIAECKPLTQGCNSDKQIEQKEKVVQDFLVEHGFKEKV